MFKIWRMGKSRREVQLLVPPTSSIHKKTETFLDCGRPSRGRSYRCVLVLLLVVV